MDGIVAVTVLGRFQCFAFLVYQQGMLRWFYGMQNDSHRHHDAFYAIFQVTGRRESPRTPMLMNGSYRFLPSYFPGFCGSSHLLLRHRRGCLPELELEGDLGSLSGDDSNDITRNGCTINFVRRFSHPC